MLIDYFRDPLCYQIYKQPFVILKLIIQLEMLTTILNQVEEVPSIVKRIPETSQIPEGKLIELKRAQYKINQTGKKVCTVIFNGKILTYTNSEKNKKYLKKQIQEQSECSQSSMKKAKNKKIRKTRQSDPDYSVKNQKKDRNVVSNLIHHFFRYLAFPSTQKEIENIIKTKKFNVTGQAIQEHIKILGNKFKTYISQKHLTQLWELQSQLSEQKNYIIRCLSYKFFRRDCFLSIFDSNKLNKSSKLVHYKGRRQLLAQLIKGGMK